MSGALVIGMGHPDRGDDAAGLHAARRLQGVVPQGTRFAIGLADGLSLIEAWQGFDLVLILDCAHSGGPPGMHRRIDAHVQSIPASLELLSSHGFGLAQAIGLARAIGRLPPRLVVLAIEGSAFEHGSPLSPEVEAGLDALCAQALSELARATPSGSVAGNEASSCTS